ncbi:hypothetical protein BSKO_03723 [Bryopsis sp. KO-2023]|nr:hypothetical protein BSKO_03723 [Bryopsis sp. KO-2023]
MEQTEIRLTADHEVELEADAAEPITSRSLSVDEDSGLVLSTSGNQNLYIGNVNDWIGASSARQSRDRIFGIPKGGDEASPVTSLSVNCSERNGNDNPLAVVLRGTLATVLDVKTGSCVGSTQSPDGMRWCAEEWHPLEEKVLAVATQATLCICMAGERTEDSDNELAIKITAKPLILGRPQRSVIAWLSSGAGFVVHWGGDVEVFEWPNYDKGGFSRSICTLSNVSRKKVLLGIGGQLRSITSGPFNSLLAIMDADLCFHLSRGDRENSLKFPANDKNGVQEGKENGDGAVIDLRGQWQGMHQHPMEGARPNGVPRELLLDTMIDTTVPPAKLCVFWPCGTTSSQVQCLGKDRQPHNAVLPLLFPIPDIVQTAGKTVLVSSRHSPALIGVFRVGSNGVEHVINVSLAASLGGKARIQGLGVFLDRKNSRFVLAAKMAALRSPHSIFGPGGGDSVGFSGVKLACFDATQALEGVKEDVFGREGVLKDGGSEQPSWEEENIGMSRIIDLLSSFERNVTCRLDKIDSTLVRHESRLEEMEKKCMGRGKP